MRFLTLDEVIPTFRGKRVAVVGSAPSCAQNAPRFIDSHDVVVRISNYKTGAPQGHRCDVFYSFFGGSIRKTREELRADGVKLCISKVPNSKPLQCEWHEIKNRQLGIDYRYIYSDEHASKFGTKSRQSWWFCDTYIPDDQAYLKKFYLLDRHIPTTGFAAILDVIACDPSELYLTGFDFFASGLHNVDEPWRPGNPDDPICHRPDLERDWLKANFRSYPIVLDRTLQDAIA